MSTAVHLRRATAEDSESLQRVYAYVVGPPAGQERTWTRLIQQQWIVVAEVDAQVVGFGGIDLEAVEQLKWLYLLPEYQGRGLGSRILSQLEEIGWTHGLGAIRLHAAPDAVEFYQKHGYQRIEARNHIVHDHDGVEMIKKRE
jgi:GNAT superfamily N-acetyltransferase